MSKKTSDLIKVLQRIVILHGDIPAKLLYSEGGMFSGDELGEVAVVNDGNGTEDGPSIAICGEDLSPLFDICSKKIYKLQLVKTYVKAPSEINYKNGVWDPS